MDQCKSLFELEFFLDPIIKFAMSLNYFESPQSPIFTPAHHESIRVVADQSKPSHNSTQESAALSVVRLFPNSASDWRWHRPGTKDSWLAVGFLSFYMTIYFTAGYLALAALAWAWTKIFS